MPDDKPFMAWIDHLPEVGDPIRNARSKLQAMAAQAADLEQQAAALQAQMRVGQVDLLARVMKQWTLADLQSAANAADSADPLALARMQIDDDELRVKLQPMDGWHLASEALQAFGGAGVIRQHNLLSTASESERLVTLKRLLG